MTSNPEGLSVQATVIGSKEEDVADIKLPKDISGLTGNVEEVSTSVLAALRKVQPKKGSLEFGVEIAVESGQLTALLVRGQWQRIHQGRA